jgi:hypothetical protein
MDARMLLSGNSMKLPRRNAASRPMLLVCSPFAQTEGVLMIFFEIRHLMLPIYDGKAQNGGVVGEEVIMISDALHLRTLYPLRLSYWLSHSCFLPTLAPFLPVRHVLQAHKVAPTPSLASSVTVLLLHPPLVGH